MTYPQVLRTVFFLSVVVLLISTSCTTPSDKHKILINDYNMITPYPDAIRLDTSSFVRFNSSIHGSTYESDASWENVSAHYSEQLEHNGWAKVDEGSFPQGGKCLSYKKGDLLAKLDFGGAGRGNFYFGLSWNLTQSC